MAFTTLSDDDVKEFWRLSGIYWREAKRCEGAGAYLAGCVMIGSALETLLCLMVDAHDEEAERTGKLPVRRGKPKPLLNWDLGELLRVAKAAGWLPSALDHEHDKWDGRKAHIGDHAEVLRELRNLVHPGRYRKAHFRRRVTARYLRWQFEVALLCRDWLAHHNNEALRERLRAAETEPPHR